MSLTHNGTRLKDVFNLNNDTMTTEQNEIKSAEWRKKNLSKNSVSADVSGSFISKFKEIIYSDLSDSEIVNALHKLDNDR